MEELYVNRQIREALIDLAVENKTISFSRLNTDSDTGYDFRNPEDREEFNDDLEAISLSEVKNNRPPLTSLVVFKGGSTSKKNLEGFYDMCEELYELSPETTKPNAKFLKSLQQKCFEYWQVRDNFKEFGPKNR